MKRSLLKVSVLGLCLFLTTALKVHAQDIKTLSKEYIDSYYALKQDEYSKYLANDVTWSDPTWSEVDKGNKPVSGKAQMLAHLAQATAGIDKMTFEIDNSFVSGPMAIFEGVLKYTWNDKAAGKSYNFSMRAVSALEFSNGKIVKHTDYANFKAWLKQYRDQM